tara:strand:+ start:223 stop:1017 length:795 start_codon:yes stop_codon:yes gene_type:complete
MGNVLISYKKFGFKRDFHDCRDLILNVNVRFDNNIDLSELYPIAIYNQSNLGSCISQCLAFIYEFDSYKQKDSFQFIPSRLFIYYNIRKLKNTTNIDTGASLRDGIKTFNTFGVCSEDLWPYNINKFKSKPSQMCYNIAKYHKNVVYKRVSQNLDIIKSILTLKYPIVFGFKVYTSFYNVSKNGIVILPKADKKSLGMHCVVIVGFNDNNNSFKVRNSWGRSWGDYGYCYFPYDYICNADLCFDFWTMYRLIDDNINNNFDDDF